MKVRFWFRKCQTNTKNPKGVLYGYILLNGIRSKEFSTGISVEKKQWDAKNQIITKNQILNQELQNLKNLLFKAKQKLEFEKSDFSVQDVLNLVFYKPQKKPFLIQVWQEFLQKKENSKKYSYNTIRNHKSMFRTFCKFMQDNNLENLPIEEFKKHHLQSFINSYRRTTNVVAKFISAVKNVFQYAIEKEYIQEHPLLSFKIEREKRVNKTHLEKHEIEKIENLNTNIPNLNKTKDIFLVLCYTGLNISDYLVFSQNPKQYIHGNFIIISRKKNHQKSYIPITQKLQTLFEKYDYVLPTFKNPQTINKNLKKIGKILNIEAEKMKTKIGRKTFAHNYLNSNIDRKAVSKMLGHAKTSTLEQYYADVDFEFVKKEVLKNAPEI
ncbi:MAG: tyrosine-type recombinase/integrase [Raineya sp.]|nr:site-specific integrase [Raineya sp.]MDW8296630.1 tyrosine-type recombinase/integrase [Raineya sp.]